MKCPDNMGSWEFFDYLLNEIQVVGTPGEGFATGAINTLTIFAVRSAGRDEESATVLALLVQYISLCEIYKFIAKPVLYTVYIIDFFDRHIFVNDFIYHIVVIKGVYTDRHKVGIEACASIGITHIVLGFHKIEILQGIILCK